MHTTNYFKTFIPVADDCPVSAAEIPPDKGGAKTVAGWQFDIIRNNPYQFTSDEVLFKVHAIRNNIAAKDIAKEREKFFSRGQACLRSSPLTRRYGWGIHCNEEGKVALYAMESADYRQFSSDKKLKQQKALRSKRV